MLLDIVFSLDSVITAVGMAQHVARDGRGRGDRGRRSCWCSRAPIGDFVAAAPDGEDAGAGVPAADRRDAGGRGLGQHIPKGYIYFAMAFSLFVEMLNLRIRKRRADRAARALRARRREARCVERLAEGFVERRSRMSHVAHSPGMS